MNASHDPLNLVNSYGAFGTVGKNRYDLVLKASYDKQTYHEIEFKCKPTNQYKK